jgi:protein YIPF5/7
MRNHLLDPESSPQKSSGDYQSYNQPGNEDPWFESSPQSFGQPQSGKGGHYGAPAPAGQYTSAGFGPPPVYNNPQGVAYPVGTPDEDNYEDEPPLLEELGIRFDHIWSKTQAVVNPTQRLSDHILDDADLAGPVIFCLLLGGCLLLAGKVHFGYIYGFSMFGCLGMNMVMNLLHPTGIELVKTCSVLGYGLLPVIGLAGLSILLNLKGPLGLILATVAISWSTFAAVRLFDAKMGLTEVKWLVAYPVVLLYSCFVLITVF